MRQQEDATYEYKTGCLKCDSSDAMGVWSDGHGFCFSCRSYFNSVDRSDNVVRVAKPVSTPSTQGFCGPIIDRKITERTCKKFGVTIEMNNGIISRHFYPYYTTDGEKTAQKTRVCLTKDFYFDGPQANLGFFGQQTCSGRGKYITITEGECDALAVSEMFDNKWDVVSLRNGASGAKKEIQTHLEWLEGYENVVIAFDNDKAGKEALESVKGLFSPKKLKILKFPEGIKDAGDMLKTGRVQDFIKAFWDAETYKPEGIVSLTDIIAELEAEEEEESIPYPWDGLDKLTYGIRKSELVTITSGSGMGKSQLLRELEYYLYSETRDNIAIVALEEVPKRSGLGIASIMASKPLHLTTEEITKEVKLDWLRKLDASRFCFWKHWGSTDDDTLFSRIRYMVKVYDCKYVILDHLSIVVSSQDNGDERKAIDAIMTKLRTLVQELGICLFLVSHLKRSSGKAHEDGGQISLSELRGSQAIAQLSDIVIGLERNQQHDDEDVRNTSVVRVLKNRYSGLTGPACYLRYNPETGRMLEVPKPEDMEDEF